MSLKYVMLRISLRGSVKTTLQANVVAQVETNPKDQGSNPTGAARKFYLKMHTKITVPRIEPGTFQLLVFFGNH